MSLRDRFEGMYADRPDPWGFETSAYEQAKYDATIAALGPAATPRALEIGCSIGVLSERLAARCDALLARRRRRGRRWPAPASACRARPSSAASCPRSSRPARSS